MRTKIDIERCRRGALQIGVIGSPVGREDMIEEAIEVIQKQPDQWGREYYLGMKQYAGFGDQRCDCEYGFGPSYGHIVFEIFRRGIEHDAPLDDDAVYLLECVRDFGIVGFTERGSVAQLNLIQVIGVLENAETQLQWAQAKMAACTVESHLPPENVNSQEGRREGMNDLRESTLDEQIEYMQELEDTYFGNMEGCDEEEFRKWEGLCSAAHKILQAMCDDRDREDKEAEE